MLLSESAPGIAGKMCRRRWSSRDSVSEFFILFVLLTVTTVFSNGVTQQQYFRVIPKDVRVQEGGEAVLECEVGNVEGQVQWTKDGFGLGSDSVIPGHPSYSMQNDKASGVFNLRIRNVTLADDAEFQCQVGPYHYHKPIRAHARLTVIAPPSSVEIVGHMPNDKIEIRENTPLTLECIVRNSRPAAQIEWYRGRAPLKIDGSESSSSPSEGSENPDGRKVAKRYNVTSRITITPTAEDDFAEFSCQAKHEALAPDMPMKTSVQLSVLYPPGPPYIEGYTTGENFRRGQTVELVCRSRGGNPPAQLVWWRGKEILRSSYRTIGRSGRRISENTLTFEAQPSDDGATLRCEASNAMVSTSPGGTKQKMSAEVKLSVLFAPTRVIITGPTEARVGETVPLTCIAGASNPAAETKWTVGDKQLKNTTFRTIPANSAEAQSLHFGPGRGSRQRSEGNRDNKENNDANEENERDSRKLGKGGETESNGGWITISNITAVVSGSHRRSLVVLCLGVNMQLTENMIGTHTINILYPPSQPMIHGYTEGVPIEAGTVQRISCVSSGGNPLATISWFKNGKKVNSVMRVTETSVSAEVTIVTNASDNGAVYRCEASNSATEVPLSESITLNVHFAPENVKIRTEPSRLRTGQEASLTCESSSSYPPAHLTWWRDGIPIPQDNRIGNADGDGPPGNGTTITRSGLDGGRVSVSVLYLGKANAALAGASFACQASNEALDKSVHDTITLQILYKPKFVEKMEGEKAIIVVAEGESTNVTLLAEGNPPDITYTWTKDGAPLKSSRDSAGRQRVTWDGPTLNLTNALREDAGKYTVEAVNSEGSDTTSIIIDVHYPPSIYELPRVVVVSKDEDAVLSCSADGNPLPEGSVHWRREGNTHSGGGPAVTWSLIPPGGTVAPHTGEGRIIPTFYPNGTSILRIQRAELKDAGPYVCVASNGVGQGPLVSKSTFLIVKHAPEMDPSPGAWKAASSLGGSARLVCRARGAPKPTFSWSFNGAAITPSISTSSSITSSTSSPQSTNSEGSSEKYQILYHEVDPSTWESVLVVRGVRHSDYGAYECGANNELGSFTANAVLSPASRPDPPVSLSVRNATHDSVLLSWVPGFDGGARVAFQIRYKKIGTVRKPTVLSDKGDDGNGGETLASLDDHSQEKKEDFGGPYYYVDVMPPGVTSFAVTGLSPSTEYTFSIMAKNRLGNSDYSGPPLRVTTTSHVPSSSSSKAPSSSSSSGTNSSTSTTSSGQLPKLVIVVVTVVGAALLVLNVVLIVCFVRRRTQKKRRLAAAASEQGSSKSATIEMYASSYNETVTGETLSSISEKSESYSNGGDSNEDYIEDSTKPAASTYLIDQIEPPSQYAYQAPPAATMHLHSHPHPHHHHHHMHASHGTLRQQQQIPGDGTLSRRKPASNAYMMHTPMEGQGVVDMSAGVADHSSLDRNEDDVGGSFVDTLRRNPYSHGMGGVIPPPMSEQHQAYYSGLSPDNPYTANAVYPPAPLGFGPTPPMSTTSSAPTSIAPPLVVVGNGSLPPDVTMMAPYPYLGGGATYSTKGTIPRSGARPSPIGPTPPSSSASSSPPPPPPPPLPALSTFSPSSMVVGVGQNADMEGHLV